MGTIASETGTSIYAWALMINHAHILLRSGPSGLPQYMRRLLSGYAISYNHRHRRHGHLFQNRYKSIVCEENPYFKQLIEQSDTTRKEQFSVLERLQQAALLIDNVCKKEKVSVASLKSGSRRQNVSRG
jgi:hypothetical protein